MSTMYGTYNIFNYIATLAKEQPYKHTNEQTNELKDVETKDETNKQTHSDITFIV